LIKSPIKLGSIKYNNPVSLKCHNLTTSAFGKPIRGLQRNNEDEHNNNKPPTQQVARGKRRRMVDAGCKANFGDERPRECFDFVALISGGTR